MKRLRLALLLLVACGGGDAAGPAVESYTVEAGAADMELIDGVVYVDGTLRVLDHTGTRIDGARVRVEVTAGDVSAGATSGVGGLVSYAWAVPGGALPAVLRACASNSTAPCTDWFDVLTLDDW